MRTSAWHHLLGGVLVLAAGCTGSTPGGLAAAGPTPTVEVASSAPTPDAASPVATATPAPAVTADATTAVTQAAPTPTTTPPANAEALDFRARRLSGGAIDGVQLAGGDVALWMWAPWCPQCNREAPHVAEAAEAWGDRVRIVGVAGHDTDDAHRAFVAEHGLEGLVHLVDDDGSVWAHYGVGYQPAWVLIDEDGGVERIAGGLYEDLDARLRALVDG